ncbi:MAG TPA: hypothetical protein VMN36_17925 [Verrucomicrobiales bacterium]|nr:hypothetical protein [Verrucomicrobiales bacterium]
MNRPIPPSLTPALAPLRWTACLCAAAFALSSCETNGIGPLFGKDRKKKQDEETEETAGDAEDDAGPDLASGAGPGSGRSVSSLDILEMRVAAASATPFFDTLESRADGTLAKPSRYLNRGTKVGILEHDRESGFSRVSLPDASIGYIPSRLLFKDDAPLPTEMRPPPSVPGTGDPGPNSLDPAPGETVVRPPIEAPSPRIPEPGLLPPGED